MFSLLKVGIALEVRVALTWLKMLVVCRELLRLHLARALPVPRCRPAARVLWETQGVEFVLISQARCRLGARVLQETQGVVFFRI